MAGTYEIWLTDDHGLRLALLDNFLSLSASRKVSAIAPFTMDLPASFDTALIVPDHMIQVWRAPTGGGLSLWRVYPIRWWEYSTHGADEALTIGGPDCNDWLRRRINAAYAGSANASVTATEADDLMKDIVTDMESDVIDPAPAAGSRAWADLTVAGDLTNGPQLDKDYAWDYLLKPSGGGLLSTLAKASREADTEVFFDVVPANVTSSSIAFQFRTYTGQPGQDVSDRVIFDQERGNLADPFLRYDYTDEINYVYAGGPGQGTERDIQQVYDADRYNISQWNRCEGFADARNQSTSDGIADAGRALLESGRPHIRFGGVPIDTQGTRFGRDWDFGDKVRARYRGQEFDAIIRAVVLSVDRNGKEKINARLEYEG